MSWLILIMCKSNESKRCRRNGKQRRPWSDWPGSTMFAQAYLSKNLGSLQYTKQYLDGTVLVVLHIMFTYVHYFANLYMSSNMTKPTKWLCVQRRLRSAWASTQSDQSLRDVLNVLSYGPKLSSCGQRRLWSGWADAQDDLSLRWA